MDHSQDSRIIDLAVRMLFIGLFIYSALLIVTPLAGVVLWGIILCVAVYPLYERLAKMLGGRSALSAALLTLVGLVLTVGPLAASISALLEWGGDLTSDLEAGKLGLPPTPQLLKDLPVFGSDVDRIWTLFQSNLDTAIKQYGSVILDIGGAIAGKVAGAGLALLGMTLSVIVMGLMLKPAPALVGSLRRLANRVFAPRGGEFVTLAGATVRNVTRGVLGVAAIQAGLAGLVMWLFGVPAAGSLAAACLFLAIIQIGAGIVLIPVAIWAWTDMPTLSALLFTVLIIPVAIVDNFLRPIFIARGLKTPMLVIIIGVIGGMLAFGLIGLFIGPVLLAIFYDLLIVWMNIEPDENVQTDNALDPAS